MLEECLICCEEKNNFDFYECAHKVCTDCNKKINNLCPFCRHPIKNRRLQISRKYYKYQNKPISYELLEEIKSIEEPYNQIIYIRKFIK